MAGLLVVATLLVGVASGRRLGVAVADDASYAVTLDGAAWLRSAPLAVFVDGRRFFPQVPEDQFPAQLLCVELYREGGVRTVEIGSNLIGRDPDTGDNIRPALDLCRLAIPRRVYFREHLEHVVDAAVRVAERHKGRTTGLEFLKEAPGIRHFASTFKFVGGAS